MTNNPQNCAAKVSVEVDEFGIDWQFKKTQGWDLHHEGHSGYLAINIANNNLKGWLASAKPDLIMFMLGTNDVNGQRKTSDITAAYTKMVGLMRESNPNMKIIVSLL